MNINTYQPGDTITGTISIELQPTEKLSEIDYVTVMNKETPFAKISTPPFKFDIDTRWWLNGNQILSIGVYKINNNVGVLKLFNEPAVIYFIPLVFKHQPLPPVTDGFKMDASGGNYITKISWNQPILDDVNYFVVEIFGGYDAVISDTLKTNLVTSYEKIISPNFSYFRVGAGNEFGITFSEKKYIWWTN